MTAIVDSARRRLTAAGWLLIVPLLGLPLITPLLRLTAVACTHDGHLHYHRVAAMTHAWGNSVYLTRWLPDLAFGYGYPFFVYREAAPLYAVLMPHLAGLPLPAASNLFYGLTILAAGVFMALWTADVLGRRAAVVAAVAYMAAPYVLVDALVRGNAPESLALPLLPLLLWAGRRWVRFGSRGAFVVGVVALALLSLAHNISTFIFAPTLAVYLAALAWFGGRAGARDEAATRPGRALLRTGLVRAGLLLVIGLGLAFFYTGGALLEMDEVTLEMSTTTRNNDWRNNFASLREVLSPVVAEDPTLLNPPLRFRLGWVPLILAASGAASLLWRRGDNARQREERLHVWLMLAATAVYLFMALPLSWPAWEALPLIDFVQFPWRFVGRAALPVAFLAGVPFAARTTEDGRRPTADRGPRTTDHRTQTTDGRPRASDLAQPIAGDNRPSVVGGRRSVGRCRSSVVFPALAIALLLIEAIPNLYPRYCVEEPFPTILTVHAYERATGLVGVDPEGSYFPRTVQARPVGSPLEADYAAGRPPQRFDATALPARATLQEVVNQPLGVSLIVESPAPFTARFLSFAFPGWTARVDGAAVPITPEDSSGLITFDVPAGSHRVDVSWGATPLRLALVAVSALAGVAAVVVATRAGPGAADRGRPGRGLGRREGLALVVLAAALLGLKLVVDRVETPLRRAGAPAVDVPGNLSGGGLRLDGYNLNRVNVPAGETFDIDMAWTAEATPAADLQTEVWLAGDDGLMWSEKGTARPRLFEDTPQTREWPPGAWAWDSREVAVLPGTPPGEYDVVLTLFDKATLAPLTLTDTATGTVGPTAVIGRVTVANPDEPPDFAPQYPLAAEVAPGLGIAGFNQDRADAAPGDTVLLTLFWECSEPAACADFTVRLENEGGQTVQSWTLPVISEDFTAEAWPSHGRLRGQYPLRLPGSLPSGTYRFALGEHIPLGELAIAAPERVFSPPPLAQTLDAAFTTDGGQAVATLVGLAGDAPPCAIAAGQTCRVPLVWRADAETPVGYRVFVHVVDAAGNIVAQSDGVPAAWTRPTTGWLPGEYVRDEHTLALPAVLPAGEMSLRVGLYDPAGDRLPVGEGNYVTIHP